MQAIHIIMSELCNLDCDFCCIQSPKRHDILDSKTFIEWFKSFENKSESYIFHFTGGEPILQSDKILDIIENTNVTYEIGTNLTYEITPKIMSILERCAIFTSWDPIPLRFKTQKNFELWKENCELIKPRSVAIILTKEVLSLDPRKIFEDMLSYNITTIEFWYLCLTGNASRLSSPSWDDIDNWLCRAYDNRLPELSVNSFDILRARLHKESSFDKLIQVDIDGSINIPPVSENIQQFPKQLISAKKVNIENVNTQNKSTNIHLYCSTCWFYIYCVGKYFHFRNKDDFCAFPKKLAKRIASDSNIMIV